jgi:hypothetical protein
VNYYDCFLPNTEKDISLPGLIYILAYKTEILIVSLCAKIENEGSIPWNSLSFLTINNRVDYQMKDDSSDFILFLK